MCILVVALILEFLLSANILNVCFLFSFSVMLGTNANVMRFSFLPFCSINTILILIYYLTDLGINAGRVTDEITPTEKLIPVRFPKELSYIR